MGQITLYKLHLMEGNNKKVGWIVDFRAVQKIFRIPLSDYLHNLVLSYLFTYFLAGSLLKQQTPLHNEVKQPHTYISPPS